MFFKKYSEFIVLGLKNNLEIMLVLALPQIILEDSDFPSYTLSFILSFNFV